MIILTELWETKIKLNTTLTILWCIHMDMAILDIIHMVHMLDMEHMDMEATVDMMETVALEDMEELINGEDTIRTMLHGNLDNMEHILALKTNLIYIWVLIQLMKLMMD